MVFWRRERESNPPTRICNPVHNRFAIAPHLFYHRRHRPRRNRRIGRKSGAGEESRTLDLYLGKVSLYQLSYSRMKRVRIIKACPWLSTLIPCWHLRLRHHSPRANAADPLQSGAATPFACNSPSTRASGRQRRRSARSRPAGCPRHRSVPDRAAGEWPPSAHWS